MNPRVSLFPHARIALTLLAALAAATVAAQEPSFGTIPTDGTATVEQIDGLITTVEARADLEETLRTSVLEQLRDARLQVENRIAAERAAAEFADALINLPAQTRAIRDGLNDEAVTDVSLGDLGISERTPLQELEQRLAQERAELATAQSRIAGTEAQIAAEEARPAQARQRIVELRQRRDELTALAGGAAAPGQPALLTDASRLAARLRLVAQAAEIGRLEQEILSHGVRIDYLTAEREMTERARLEAEGRAALIGVEVNLKRQAAAVLTQQAAAAAELAAADKHPVVRALAEGNARLTLELPAIASDIEAVTTKLRQIDNEKREIGERLARSRQRIEVGGLSRAIGELLEEERRELPQFARYPAELRSRSGQLADIGLAELRIQEQRRELASLDANVDRTMAGISGDVADADDLAEIRREVRLLLRDRRDLLAQAERTYSSYLQVLVELDTAQRELLDVLSAYEDFLSQNQLWIPSAPLLGLGKWSDLREAFAWALSPTSWQHAAATFARSVSEQTFAAVAALVLLAVLLMIQRPMQRAFKSMSKQVGRLSTDNIGLTLRSLVIAALRSLPLPLLLAIVGWFLRHAEGATSFTGAISMGLFAAAPFLYNVVVFRVLSARDGILQVHFHWQDKNLGRIRRQLDRLITIGAPLVFAVVFFYLSEEIADRHTVGRLSFMLLMVLLSIVIHPLVHPVKGVVSGYYDKAPVYWASRLRWLWYGLGVVGPLLLAAVSALGYLYTALILTSLLVDTIWLALAMILANLVVLRWLALTKRKLALKIALDERKARLAEREKEKAVEVHAGKEGEAPAVERQPLDLDEVDQQTRKVLRSALLFIAVVVGWGIWAQVFPAFGLLEQVALWSKVQVVEGAETIVPVTLADVLLAMVIAIVTMIASKNLPGLMEIAVLQRLTLQPGSRYAIITLVRYVVVTIGVIAVLSVIGWDWSRIQWLVAALSVGLGFGLQEIVANFVSGLIILFERPVRVGDTVTVGQLTGTVTRVRIRATTITDWDRKEIIVPNKAFITEQVVNWTLSDPITRLVIPVGISYGSDVGLAHRVMEEVLKSMPLVLDEPEPKVWFVGFGESSLDFNLYVYLRQLSDRLPLTHAVHESIFAALKEHGIEIPFPQRDIHVRSTVDK
ncbi:MAG: mechanosensitive ion channel [Gammaproteobacteria bacterium]|nr:mechanosensitive ion channel [Gammaproteobacteria bacterium]MDH5344740.1 mechanosensitive ion channel [Gammaproteobacteria bacterium]